MKTSSLIAISLLSLCLTPSTTGWSSETNGYEIVKPKPKIVAEGFTAAQLELANRLVGVRPLCSELWNVDNPVARKVGPDWVLVVPNPETEQYIMFGIHFPESAAPVTTWQGGSLAGAIDQVCADQVPGERIH